MTRTTLTCFRRPFVGLPFNIPTRPITQTKADTLAQSFFKTQNCTQRHPSFNKISTYRQYSSITQGLPLPCSISPGERAYWLIKSVLSGERESVSHMLSEGANPNQAVTDGNYVLHYAAELGNSDLVRTLLNAGARINIQTIEKGDTPLHRACMNGNDGVVENLLQNHAKFSIKNNDGYTPLELTIIFQNLKCAKLLIHKKAPINQLNPISGCTPLMLACREGSYPIANLLVYFNADTNFRGDTTPLHLAANHPQILQLLLDHGALLGSVISTYSSDREQIGDSPLHTAARWGNLQSVKILLNYHSNPHHTNKLNQTPLDVARLQLMAHRIKPSNSQETTKRVCEELDKVTALLDLM